MSDRGRQQDKEGHQEETGKTVDTATKNRSRFPRVGSLMTQLMTQRYTDINQRITQLLVSAIGQSEGDSLRSYLLVQA